MTETTHNATVQPAAVGHHEQCPRKLIATVLRIIFDDLTTEIGSGGVARIGVSGQMHGIVLWNSESVRDSADPCNWCCSNLITWMDQRCGASFLKSLPEWKNERGEVESRIATGYGLATLAWLRAHDQIDPCWDRCGTIMELLIAVLTGVDLVPISTQNAYHWGYCIGCSWQIEALRGIVPIELLPPIVEVDHIVGTTYQTTCLPVGVEVIVALGDSQASYLPVLCKGEAVLHLGTSAQLVLNTSCISTDLRHQYPMLMKWPYFGGHEVLVAAASLNGGNAYDVFIKQIALWSHELYGTPKSPELLPGVLEKALSTESALTSSLEFSPLFHGERHNPHKFASVRNWCSDTTLTEMLHSIARGTIHNLRTMLPPQLLADFGVKRICLTNRAAQPIYEQIASAEFSPLTVYTSCDSQLNAAYGAALWALRSELCRFRTQDSE